MRKPLLAGNWKMNKTTAELQPFFTSLVAEAGASATLVDVLFAVPFTLLSSALKIAKPLGIRIAAQNVHFAANGAYTGETSIAMLKDIGIDTTLVGHSERRQYFGETDDTVAKKTKACLEQGLTPIVCVGESKEERTSGKTNDVLKRQVETVLSAIGAPGAMIIAYEPVWAIGTGLNATTAQAEEAHAYIRKLVSARFSKAAGDGLRILYGGSANPANFAELIAQADIDGGLVGGASLKPADFAAMINQAAKTR